MDLTFRTKPQNRQFRSFAFLPHNLRQLATITMALSLANLALVSVFYLFLQTQIPLFYSLPNDQQLTHKVWLFLVPTLGVVINMLHFTVLRIKTDLHEQIIRMFVHLSFLLQILLLAISLRIIIIIF